MNPHLPPELHGLLDLSAEERISKRWPEIMIALDQVNALQNALRQAAMQPDQERQINLFVCGQSGVGKSKALQLYVDNVRAEAQLTQPTLGAGYANIPSFRASVPVRDQASFYVRVLAELGRKDRRTRTLHQLSADATELMKRCGVRLPIFDEFHNSSPEEEGIRTFAATLKDIGATLQRPLVLAGTDRALRIIENDPELSTRYSMIEMHPFPEANAQFEEMLYNFEISIPLRKASFLFDKPLSETIFKLTRGLMGNVSPLLMDAAIQAINDKSEQITESLLNNLTFAQTLKRRLKMNQS